MGCEVGQPLHSTEHGPVKQAFIAARLALLSHPVVDAPVRQSMHEGSATQVLISWQQVSPRQVSQGRSFVVRELSQMVLGPPAHSTWHEAEHALNAAI